MGYEFMNVKNSFYCPFSFFLLDKGEIKSILSSVAQLCPSICDPMDCTTPGFPVRDQLLGLTQTHVHRSMMPSNHLILCNPLFLLPSIFPNIRVFSKELVLRIRWPKYWSFSEDLHTWKVIPCSWIGRFNIGRIAISSKLIYGFNIVSKS